MSKLYDFFMVGFPYEADVLYLKLLEEHEHVERFYMVETNQTHQGNPKPYYWGKILREPRFQRFADQIQYDMVSSRDLGFIKANTPEDAQHNEHAQRNWIYLQHKGEIADDDIVWVSDCDEILGGEDIPKILEAFDSQERLKGVHIPLLHTTYDYAYVDEERGYWPTVALRRQFIDTLHESALANIRAFFYQRVLIPSMTQIARPDRYQNQIPIDQVAKLLGKAVRQVSIYNSLKHLPNETLGGLLVDPRLAGYYGWHFSYCFQDPIDVFRKVRALWHSGVGKPQNIARDLAMANLRLLGHGLVTPTKPFLVKWPLNARLFPKELVGNQEYYLTDAERKMAALTEEQIRAGLGE